MPSAFRILLYFISNIPITQLQISCKKLCVALLSIMHHPANTRLGKKRVEAVLKTSWKMKNCYAEDIFKTSWKTRNVCWTSFDFIKLRKGFIGFTLQPFSRFLTI